MLTKLDYLKAVINTKLIENKSWYFSCFSIPLLKDETNWEHKEFGEIVTKLDGLYFVNVVAKLENGQEQKELVKISDYVKEEPLFRFQDVITVDPSWGPYITSKFETKLGNLIINALIIYPSFKNKLG